MDPITHGIAGALLGEGIFAERRGRAAVFAATLGAVFPDVDVVAELVSRDPLAIVKYHRGITHSFVALPFFAALLAWLTRAMARRRGIETPSWPALALIYGVGIASHIFLDGTTSFGTRMWTPLSQTRVAWDLMFIIDFVLSSCVLLPQVAAWIYSAKNSHAGRSRALRMWAVFSAAAFVGWAVALVAGYPFHLWIVAVASAGFAGLFFVPANGGMGSGVTREAWSQIGAFVALTYLFTCSVAHHEAILQAKAYADRNHIPVERMGALPIPPSWLDWGEAVRSVGVLFETQVDLREPGPPIFNVIPDSLPDEYITRASEMPSVRLYWTFARFPSVQSFRDGNQHVVELGENRFQSGMRRGPQPFTYEVIFDAKGNLVEEGWLTNAMLQSRMRRLIPQPTLPPPSAPAKKSP